MTQKMFFVDYYTVMQQLAVRYVVECLDLFPLLIYVAQNRMLLCNWVWSEVVCRVTGIGETA
jgi:hypothetical protein